MSNDYLKEMKILHKLREENVPHAVIITEESVNETVFTSKAILIPKFFKGYQKYDFLYLTQVNDKTAERDIKYITAKDLDEQGEYRVKFRGESGIVYQWNKYEFPKICQYTTIFNNEKITHLNYRERKIWLELLIQGSVPSFEIGGKYYFDVDVLFNNKYKEKFYEMKRQIKGFDLFEDNIDEEIEKGNFDLFDGEL